MKPPVFLAGMNVEGNDVREFPETIVEILKPTPIQWLRVHQLRNRFLDEKGPNGLTYLDGIEYLCKNGYNIVTPIEVGSTTNVGVVTLKNLDKFVEEAYHESFKACKKISQVVNKHGRKLIFGIENEIDPKAWILQSLPGIQWRFQFEGWVEQALNPKLKYQRLNNILKGARDAYPEAETMANIVAEDVRVFFRNFEQVLVKHKEMLKECTISFDELLDDQIDWKTELKYLRENLNVDYVGLDNYANWILKYPIYGQETGSKIKEAANLTGKKIFNAEFGYTTYRTFIEKLLFTILRRPNASQMQLQFFQNTLKSLDGIQSVGTFPWVLMSHPQRPATPQQESYFGLVKMDRKGQLKKEPAFDYYTKWLSEKISKSLPP